MKKVFLQCFCFCALILSLPVDALPRVPAHLQTVELDFELLAESAIIYDVSNDSVLYEKNADTVHAIASLTKLVTIFLALEAAARGDFFLHNSLDIHPDSYASAQEPGSSLLFLGPGQRVTGLDLLYGLAVSSGNDAAHAIAREIAGSPRAFVSAMNDRMRDFGYTESSFVDSSGLGAGNRSTARELADFAARLYRRWETATVQLFSKASFRFPHDETGIVQYNRNTLLGAYPGVDGLKTGYTEEAGYAFVGSALHKGRRIVIVLLGLHADTRGEGYRLRHEQAFALFDAAFSDYSLYTSSLIPGADNNRVAVHKGSKTTTTLRLGADRHFYLHNDQLAHAQVKFMHPGFLEAPIQKGEHITDIFLTLGSSRYAIGSLQATETIDRVWFGAQLLQWLQNLFLKPDTQAIRMRIHALEH